MTIRTNPTTKQNKKLSRSQIIDKLRDILEPWVSDTEALANLEENTNLTSQLGLDSVGILQVILEAEKGFGIKIDDNRLDSKTFSKAENLIDLIEKKLNETD